MKAKAEYTPNGYVCNKCGSRMDAIITPPLSTLGKMKLVCNNCNKHMTKTCQERFIEWLTERLKKDWKGFVPNKPGTRNLRKKIAEEFVFYASPVIRPLNINDFMSLIPWGQLDEQMSKGERERFNKWTFGQTCSPHGVYRSDLERWLMDEQARMADIKKQVKINMLLGD